MRTDESVTREGERSPFGAPARLVLSQSTAELARRYREKCGADVAWAFRGQTSVSMFECTATGYQFWRPAEIAGDERFYQTLAHHWPNYYRDWRWEYGPASEQCAPTAHVLEVGCGRGYFLRHIEDRVASVEGVELNTQAAERKVTRALVHTKPLQELLATHEGKLDVVCSFQVLEHVVEPRRFIEECSALLKPGGLLLFSTPNHAADEHQGLGDPFNLPPHHMGHFSAETFARIAETCQLSFVSCSTQPDRSAAKNPLVAAISNAWRSLRRSEGLTLLATLRKAA